MFEALGYVVGYVLYRRARMRQGDALGDERRWMVIAAAAVGALVGSRLLGLAEMAPVRGMSWHDLLLPGGKTIVGGLLGGWLAVELAKRAMGLRARTGDLFAVPLCVGIAVGRVGCFFAGLADDTYGKATTLPWGVNFGDGVRRHPTQIYEIVFLIGLAWVLTRMGKNTTPPMRALTRTHEWGTQISAACTDCRARYREGTVFRVFLAAYLAWRLAIDFLKPQPLVWGLNVIQWACVFGLVTLGVAEMGKRGDRDDG